MKRQLVIGCVISIALVAAMWLLAPEHSPASPGPLAAGHKDLACSDCHSPFTSFASDSKCLLCHETQKMTPQAVFDDVRCVDCHSEHLGHATKLTHVGNDKCQRCHDWKTVHDQTPVKMAWKRDSPPRDCDSCHGSHTEHKLHVEPKIADVRKHLADAHRRASPWFHKDTCIKCHHDKATVSSVSAASIPGFFDPHVTHVSRLNIRCTWCHSDVDITQSTSAYFRRTSDPERCIRCHGTEYYAAEMAHNMPEAGR